MQCAGAGNRTYGTSCVIFAIVLLLAGAAWAQPTGTSGGDALLPVDYDNAYFQKTRVALPGVRIVRVEDRRGSRPAALGSLRADDGSAVPLVLAESVNVFVRRAFDIMLGAPKPGESPAPGVISARDVRLALGIEQFELVDAKDPKCARLDARLAVARIDSAGPTELGWVVSTECEGWIMSPAGARTEALYRGTAALVQSLTDATLGLSTSAPAAATPSGAAGRPTVKAAYVAPNRPVSYGCFYGGYVGFAAGDMQDAYEGSYWGGGEYRTWFYGGSGASMALGLLGGEGPVQILDPDFNYEVAEVSYVAGAFEASYLYRFRRRLDARTWFPYAGIGGDWYFGSERVNMRITDGPDMLLEVEETVLRTSVAAHVMAGAEFVVARRASIVLEARWTQGGNGASSHGTPDPGTEEELIDQILHSLVRTPDFNFTGWGARLLLNIRI